MTKPNSTAIPPHDFYVPREGDSAAAVAEGYDNNFQTLDTSKVEAGATLAALDTKVDKVDGAGLITDAEREKLEGVEAGANAYSLPAASAETLGGIRIGRNLTISEDGSVDAPYAGGLDPDSLGVLEQVSASDRLLTFSEAGDPQTATAQQLRDYAADGLASTEQVNAALAGKVNKTGDAMTGLFAFHNASAVGFAPQGETQPKFQLYAWDRLLQLTRRAANGDYMDAVFNVNYDTGTLHFGTDPTVAGCPVWHSGNFDPAAKQDTTKNLAEGYDLNTLHTTGTYDVLNAANAPLSGWIYVDVIKYSGGAGWVSQTVYTLGADNTPNRIFHRNGIQTSDWTPWVELWHSGNFNPGGCMQDGGMHGDLSQPKIGMGFQYNTGGCGTTGSYISFGQPYYPIQMTAAYWGGAGGVQNLKFRTYNGDNSTWNPWMTIFCDGNLGPATASADGLMTAADKVKLDNLPPKIIAGSVYGGGGVRKGRGFSAEVQGNYIRVTHNLGHTNYIVTATVFAVGNTNYADNTAATIAQTANDFELSVTSINGSIERCTVDFMLVCV